ncbi:MAG: ParB/RepB/Spo0J family partition protein [Clostridiales bacterium]|nr:ParB/RepB/Spo0J family partition protein [Candidatus Blautia equi]
MAVKKSGLGRGLDALFPDKNSQDKVRSGQERPKPEVKTGKDSAEKIKPVRKPAEKKTVEKKPEKKAEPEVKIIEVPKYGDVMVKISKVEPNREQPRKQFNEEALQELASSIRQYGIIQPLLVSDKKDYYEIIAGERRWRAAKIAGLKEVPVLIKEYTDQEIVEISLIENIQREDLNPIEEALAYKRLMDEFNLKQDEIAEKVARSRVAVTNSVRLLRLDERVQQMLKDDQITAGHARTLLSIQNGDVQHQVAQRILDEKLSVREIEKLVKNYLEPPKPKTKRASDSAEDAQFESLEEHMKQIFGTKVSFNRKKNYKGKIEIEYYSRDELERIIDLFNSIG